MEKLSSNRRLLAVRHQDNPPTGHATTGQFDSSIARKEGRLAGLFRTYGAWLARALRRRYGDQAEDLAQETFLRAARYGEAGAVIRHPKALLLRIAHNAAADQAQRHSEIIAREAVVVEFGDYFHDVSQSAEQVETLLLKELILQMPVTYRDVFILSRFRGMSYQAIAEELGVAIKTVEWRLSKALAYCTDALADSGKD